MSRSAESATRRARVHDRAPRAAGRPRPRLRARRSRPAPSRPPVPSTARSVLLRTRAAGRTPARPASSRTVDSSRRAPCRTMCSAAVSKSASRPRRRRRAAHPTRCPQSLPPGSAQRRRVREPDDLAAAISPPRRASRRSGCCSIQCETPCGDDFLAQSSRKSGIVASASSGSQGRISGSAKALGAQLLVSLLGLRALEAHAPEDLRRLRELDVLVGDHLDVVGSRIRLPLTSAPAAERPRAPAPCRRRRGRSGGGRPVPAAGPRRARRTGRRCRRTPCVRLGRAARARRCGRRTRAPPRRSRPPARRG